MYKEYIRTQFRIIENNIDHYNQSGLARAMLRLAKVVDEKVFDDPEFNQKPKEECVQQSNSVQGTLSKTNKSSKFVRFDTCSPLAKDILYSSNPTLHEKRIEILQVMMLSGSWLLAEYVVLPQSN